MDDRPASTTYPNDGVVCAFDLLSASCANAFVDSATVHVKTKADTTMCLISNLPGR
ncbi:hypothetical protein AKJ09_09119 [Labilithrix luteola]|uniref:Uncharacterized protein n=1 Tax=Labilithrix luteola TaxID=1391654 RepID=A0A0K1Q9I3_9BACT|nr:hypothetical protein AKJ09_09119 [Labilithrix luteola]